jgi:hypothetical protein
MDVNNLKGLYMDYLISSTQLTTCTGLSKVLDGAISHDKFTRLLSKGRFDSKSLWKQSKVTAQEISQSKFTKVLSFDDSIMPKPHTKENALNCWHFDHCSGRNIKGVQFLTALFNTQEMNVPVMMELIKKEVVTINQKTGKEKRESKVSKNELFRSMVSQCSSQLHIDYILADSWFSSGMNFKHIVGCGLDFIIALKSNRLVALSEEDKQKGKWINIKSLNLEQVTKKVWLKGIDFPLSLTGQVSKNGDDIANLYLISSDLGLSFEQVTTLYKKRWSVEQYHKEVKQITSFGKSPTKTIKTQSNHFYLSIMAYSKVEILKIRTKTNAFAMKDKVYYHALKYAMKQINELSTNQYQNVA